MHFLDDSAAHDIMFVSALLNVFYVALMLRGDLSRAKQEDYRQQQQNVRKRSMRDTPYTHACHSHTRDRQHMPHTQGNTAVQYNSTVVG